jgi:hypothetical protein
MIIEITAILSLIQCVNVLSRLIERRRDVFYYVSRPEPRW